MTVILPLRRMQLGPRDKFRELSISQTVLFPEQLVLLLGLKSLHTRGYAGTLTLVRFGSRIALWTIFVTVNTGLLALSPTVRPYVLSPTIAYYQIWDPSDFACPEDSFCESFVGWPRLNHTLIITRNSVESMFKVTALEKPYYSSGYVTAGLEFTSFTYSGPLLTPEVTGGSSSWTGPLEMGGSVDVHTVLRLPLDGRYFIGGSALAYTIGSITGAGLSFFVEVRLGVVVSVSSSAYGPEFRDIEVRCLSHCWP